MNKNEGRKYGYLHSGNGDCFVRNIPNQQVAGYPVGILYIENVNYPMVPGNVVNAYSYDFPVRMMAVPNLTNQRLFDGDPTIVDDIVNTAKHLVEKDGVRAISSACGFFGNYQKEVAAAVDVPVAMSSLVQVPLIQALLKPDQKVGIISASGESMTEGLLSACNITRQDDLVISDARHTKHFANAVVDNAGYFENGRAREEVVELAVQLAEKNPEVGAILLECSDMPPYASEVQGATGLPVFDFITLIKWLQSGVAQKPYCGWV